MRLDVERGAVELAPGLVVRRGTRAVELRAAGSTPERYGNGWGWERLEVVEGDVRWFVGVSIGPEETAEMVLLAMAGLDEPASRDQWSEERELARRDRHDGWIDGQAGPGWATEAYDGASLGRGGAYPWGRVASEYDSRSGGSSIVVDWRT